MDYDRWLQKGAGCFDDYYEADNNEIFEWYEDNYSNDVTTSNVLYNDITDLPYITSLVIEAITDKMAEDEEFIKAYDAGFVEDLVEFNKKYPERAKALCEKYISKNVNDLWNLLGREGWDSLEEEFYEDYNNREDLSYEYNFDY